MQGLIATLARTLGHLKTCKGVGCVHRAIAINPLA